MSKWIAVVSYPLTLLVLSGLFNQMVLPKLEPTWRLLDPKVARDSVSFTIQIEKSGQGQHPELVVEFGEEMDPDKVTLIANGIKVTDKRQAKYECIIRNKTPHGLKAGSKNQKGRACFAAGTKATLEAKPSKESDDLGETEISFVAAGEPSFDRRRLKDGATDEWSWFLDAYRWWIAIILFSFLPALLIGIIEAVRSRVPRRGLLPALIGLCEGCRATDLPPDQRLVFLQVLDCVLSRQSAIAIIHRQVDSALLSKRLGEVSFAGWLYTELRTSFICSYLEGKLKNVVDVPSARQTFHGVVFMEAMKAEEQRDAEQ